MTLVWIAVTLSALAWVYLAPLAGSPEPARGALVLYVALLISILGLVRLRGEIRPAAIGRALHAAVALLLTTSLAVAVVAALRPRLLSDVHRLPALGEPFRWLVTAFGLEASADPRGFFGVFNHQHLILFSVNAEKLGLDTLLLVLAAAGLLLAIARAGFAAWVRLLGVLTVYAVARFVVLVYVYANFQKPHEWSGAPASALFFDPELVLVSFLPLALLLARFLAFHTPTPRLLDLALPSRLPPPGALRPTVGAVLLVIALQFVDPGIRKPGRILVDDVHSGPWEPSTAPVTVDEYGDMTVYNLTALVEFLRFHYPSVEVWKEGTLDAGALAGVDVLVVKTPTRPFGSGEIEAVEEFVRAGGGLWLVSDHTNLAGMSTFANAIGERFGLRFRYDGCNSLSTGYFGEFHGPALLRHALTEGVPWFRLLTSATVDGGGTAEPVMIVSDLLSDPIDYSRRNFFGDIRPDPADDFGAFLLAAARTHGKGRVLAFAESTVLSTFALFQDGHVEFALASVDFLNRRNLVGRWPNLLCAIAGLWLVTTGLFRTFRGSPGWIAGAVAFSVVVGGGGGAFLMRGVNRLLHAPPVPHTPYPRVAFLARGTDYHLEPGLSRVLVPRDKAFTNFFVNLARLGLVPGQFAYLDEARGADAIVVINPLESLTDLELELLRDYVRRGGRLVVLLPKSLQTAASRRLLGAFEMNLRSDPVSSPGHRPPAAQFAKGVLAPAETEATSRIAGGSSISLDKELPIEVSIRPFGNGRIVVVLGSEAFSLAGMGHVLEEPDEERRKRYDAEYLIFHDLLGLGTVRRSSQGQEASWKEKN